MKWIKSNITYSPTVPAYSSWDTNCLDYRPNNNCCNFDCTVRQAYVCNPCSRLPTADLWRTRVTFASTIEYVDAFVEIWWIAARDSDGRKRSWSGDSSCIGYYNHHHVCHYKERSILVPIFTKITVKWRL